MVLGANCTRSNSPGARGAEAISPGADFTGDNGQGRTILGGERFGSHRKVLIPVGIGTNCLLTEAAPLIPLVTPCPPYR